MRSRVVALVALLSLPLGLSACVTANQQAVQSQVDQYMKPEADAWAQANALAEQKCGGMEKYNEAGIAGDKKAVIATRECVAKIYATQVAPFVKYRDLFDEIAATARETTRLYKTGEISFEEVDARSKSNYAKYLQDVEMRLHGQYGSAMQQAAYLDQMERQRRSEALQNLGQQLSNTGPKRQVMCSGTSNNVMCTEW